jgi:predicted metal-dependent phosphoesterase TrpH
MLKLDLHIHSQYSEDGSGNILEISKILKKKGLDGMAITDHNTIEGGISALRVASKDFVVIPGIEISTKDGHIIALNVKENIPRNLTIEETVENIIDIGGLPIVPHLYRTLSGIKEKKLKKIKNKIPAIEVFNSCSVLKTNLKTMEIAKKYKLGGTGGSDSHIPSLVGEAYTLIDTNNLNIDSIISLIEKKKTWGEGNTLDLDYRRDRMVKSVKQFFERGFKRI